MKLFAPAVTALALGCCVNAPRAQTVASSRSAATELFSRIGDWFADDWRSGWDTGSHWRVMASPYTYHYSRDPDHRHVTMIGLERQRADGLVLGGSYFKNSFGQPSTYLYVGQRFDKLAGVEPMFAQLTGGVLYGYRPPYENKVPLNINGFSPGIVPSLGWQFTPMLSAQLNFLGNSALMFQLSADFH